jgi:hypothetical protein
VTLMRQMRDRTPSRLVKATLPDRFASVRTGGASSFQIVLVRREAAS